MTSAVVPPKQFLVPGRFVFRENKQRPAIASGISRENMAQRHQTAFGAQLSECENAATVVIIFKNQGAIAWLFLCYVSKCVTPAHF